MNTHVPMCFKHLNCDLKKQKTIYKKKNTDFYSKLHDGETRRKPGFDEIEHCWNMKGQNLCNNDYNLNEEPKKFCI